MVARQRDISAWYDERPSAATHMIIACSSTHERPGCCYPVYVLAGEDPHMRVAETQGFIREVYSFVLPKHEQVYVSHRVFNYD